MTFKDGLKFGFGFFTAHLIAVVAVVIGLGALGLTGLSLVGYLLGGH